GRAPSHDLTGVAATTTQRYNLTGAGDPREVQAAAVTADLFDVLQVRPEIGHGFAPADERTPLALLSHGLWVTSFGRDPAILGRTISLDGRSFTVVGVMPAGFQFPDEGVQVWTPIGEFLSQNPQAETNRGVHFLNAVARLAPGVTTSRVVDDVRPLATRHGPGDSAGTGGRQRIVARPGRGPRAAGPAASPRKHPARARRGRRGCRPVHLGTRRSARRVAARAPARDRNRTRRPGSGLQPRSGRRDGCGVRSPARLARLGTRYRGGAV